MSTLVEENVEKIVASWRGGAAPVDGWKSPAGPMFVAGEFAEADLTSMAVTPRCGSNTTRNSCYQESTVWLICC